MMKSLPTEHQEQVKVVQYCDIKKIPILAIPNGSNKSIVAAKKFKAEGLRAGVPDLFIPLAKHNYHGLFVEMKRQKGGTVSKDQKAWIEKLNSLGYKAVVCKGAAIAIEEIEHYMEEFI